MYMTHNIIYYIALYYIIFNVFLGTMVAKSQYFGYRINNI